MLKNLKDLEGVVPTEKLVNFLRRDILRQKIRPGEDMPAFLPEHFQCHHLVWDGQALKDREAFLKVVGLERNDSCFFFPRDRRMAMEAAEILERREANRREAKKDRHLVKWSIIAGVVGAVGGAIISAIVTYLFR